MDFKQHLNELKKSVDETIQFYLNDIENESQVFGVKDLTSAMAYSLKDGGHRLRPLLALLTAEVLGAEPTTVLPFGCAIELIHTYSLIHDDLPCMDDDDFRRGKPSNHKVYGQALAVLAGDAMSSEAFLLIAEKYEDDPSLALDLIQELGRSAGPQGLAGGQAMDLMMKDKSVTPDQIQSLHMKKTAALFRLSVVGAAKISRATTEEVKALEDFAISVGLGFQMLDDLMDGKNLEEPSLVRAVGVEAGERLTQEMFERALVSLNILGPRAEPLQNFVQHVRERANRV